MSKFEPEIIFEDDHIIAVTKPSGMAVIPERGSSKKESLAEALQKRGGEIFVVHRIDKPTSGLVIFAKDAETHRALNIQFEQREVKKIYKAIVQGKPLQKSMVIDEPIAENQAKLGSYLVHQRGKAAWSQYTIVEQFRHCALVDVEIKTGRTHQIRVHMAYVGHPLLVDELYGNASSFHIGKFIKGYMANEEERPTIARLTLHASSIQFTHPQTLQQVTLESPLPKDMEVLLKLLRKNDK
jgi:23S rRNA pseudouridine1911/1915/1917 synthase